MVATEEPKVSAPPTPNASTPPPNKAEMVVVNTENTEFSAGVVGGIAGFIVGGPFLAAVLAVAANYGSKQQNEAGDAVRAVGKTAIEALNFWTNLNAKYDVTGKATTSLDSAVDKLKDSSGSGEAIDKAKTTIKDLASQASKLSSEYDIPAKAKQALGVAGELADTAIEKGIELEKEYKVTDKVTEKIKKSIDSTKS
ncbi:unnamed protein product [Sphacelaria rigidula]